MRSPQRRSRGRKLLPAAAVVGPVAIVVGGMGDFSGWAAGSGAGVVAVGTAVTFVSVATLLVRGRPHRYLHLGSAERAWISAGATRAQLHALDEIHRLRRSTPPVGYGDRRTLVNPLADAYAIFSSPAWRDPWLADRRLLIDPIAEAGEIVSYLHRVTAMVKEVRAKRAALPVASVARGQYDAYEQALLESLNEALLRAAALTRYRMELRRLEALLDDQRALPEAEAMADRVMDVLSESARHRLGTQHLEDSRAQLALVESGLREITALLTTTSLDEHSALDWR